MGGEVRSLTSRYTHPTKVATQATRAMYFSNGSVTVGSAEVITRLGSLIKLTNHF